MSNKPIMKKTPFLPMLAMALIAVTLPSQVLAFEINTTFNSGASTSPSFDPDGSKLTAMMADVATYYENIFTADWTLNVEFYYADFDGNTLGKHTNLATSGGKPTSCRIRVDDDSYWFIDSTPFNNSEYDMEQTFAGDLASPGNYYNGTVPDLLEYQYRGDSNGSAGILHYFQNDMWSLLLHEMGHGLGMTGACASGETGDYDYDFDPDLVWGNTMSAECYATDDRYHLEADTLMNPIIPTGKRTLPSATDIFAIEAAANWGDTTISLKRKEFYSPDANADMNDSGNWSGNETPNYDEDIWMRDGGTATLTSGNIGTNNLRIGNDTIVSTGAYRLRADNYMYLGDSDGDGTVVINNGGELQVDITLDIKNGSVVQMQAGSLLDADQLRVNSGGGVTGAGTIDIEDWFNNNGTLTVTGGDLTITSLVEPNLDGTNETGTIYVLGGNFACNKAMKDAFSTHFEVHDGYHVTFDEGWMLAAAGEFVVETNCYLYGGLFRCNGTLEVNGDINIYCDAQFESSATVILDHSGDDLYLRGDNVTVNAGATFTGTGEFWTVPAGTCTFDDGVEIGLYGQLRGTLIVEEDGVGEVSFGRHCTLRSDPLIVMEADGDESCDLFDVDGTLTFDGTLDLDFIDSYVPDEGDSFTLFTYNAYSGSFDSITWDGAFDLIPNYGATAFTLTVSYGDDMRTEAVPEPSTLILLLGAGCGLIFLKKRRFDK